MSYIPLYRPPPPSSWCQKYIPIQPTIEIPTIQYPIYLYYTHHYYTHTTTIYIQYTIPLHSVLVVLDRFTWHRYMLYIFLFIVFLVLYCCQVRGG